MKRVYIFKSTWCEPCKTYTPIFEKVASEIPGVNFEVIDVDSGDPRVKEYEVRSIPTTIVLNGDEIMSRQSGVILGNQLKQMIR